MTPEEYREIDAQVAEKVMGWVVKRINADFVQSHPKYFPEEKRELAHFSTDMAAAWKVWERVIADKHLIDASLHGDVRGHYYVKFTINGQATADTAPLAICLAALKAVGEPSSVSQTQ